MKILILDDNPANLLILDTILRADGWEPVAVANGLAGLEALRSSGYELIVADILMPGMDGFQFCREVKKVPAWSRIPFVFYTATYTSAEDEAFAQSLGAEAFLVKPMEPQAFLNTVRRIAGKTSPTALQAPTSPPAEQSKEPSPLVLEVEMPEDEADFYREYNVRLVKKIERKLLKLEDSNRQLRASENRFQTLASHAPVGIVQLTREGEIKFANPAARQMLSVNATLTSITLDAPSSWLSFVHPDDRAGASQAWEKALETSGTFEMEFRLDGGPESPRWIYAIAVPEAGVAGGVDGYLGTLTDVTARMQAARERLELERKLAQSQKIETLGLLVGGIAHDFNNLLTGVLGNASLVRMDLPADHASLASVAQIEKAAQRAADLCRQMLAYAGKGTFARQALDLRTVVAETLQMLRLALGRKVMVRFNPPAELASVIADPVQLGQIVMNLIINASDAIGDRDGVIDIVTETRRPKPSSDYYPEQPKEGDYVMLAVRDSGCGMTPHVLARIFEPFFSTKVAGRGLGLAAVLGIIRATQGAIRVESKPGVGSTFELFLPAASATVSASSVGSRPKLPTRSGTILLADDDGPARSVTARILESLGYKVVLARDGQEAFEVVRAQPGAFSLALMDLIMPRMDGLTAFQSIRSIPAMLPVVLMGGYIEPETATLAQKLGISVILRKPYDPETLGAAVDQALLAHGS